MLIENLLIFVDFPAWKLFSLLLISFFVGLLGGFVGLALGTIRLPFLLLFGIPPATAAGTNIIISASSSLSGMIRHFRDGRIDFKIALMMGVPSVFAAFVGGLFSHRLNSDLLILFIGGFVAWQGVEFILMSKNKSNQKNSIPNSNYTHKNMIRNLSEAGIGLVIGLLGGLVGLILGSIRLPALIRLLKVEPRIAAGTNTIIGFCMGFVGGLGHSIHGGIEYEIVLMMGLAAILGSYQGARLTGKVNLNLLLAFMGGVLSITGIVMFLRGVINLY